MSRCIASFCLRTITLMLLLARGTLMVWRMTCVWRRLLVINPWGVWILVEVFSRFWLVLVGVRIFCIFWFWVFSVFACFFLGILTSSGSRGTLRRAATLGRFGFEGEVGRAFEGSIFWSSNHFQVWRLHINFMSSCGLWEFQMSRKTISLVPGISKDLKMICN